MNDIYSLPKKRKIIISDQSLSLYSDSVFLFALPIAGKVGSADTDKRYLSDVSKTIENNCAIYIWSVESSLWGEKQYIVKVYQDYATFQIKVKGQGTPECISYFKSESSGIDYQTAGYLIPQFQDVDEHRAENLCGYDGTILPLRAAPPPFVYSFWNQYNDDHCGLGICAKAGENNYERLLLKHQGTNNQWLEVPLWGYTTIDGAWESPFIWIGFGNDHMDVIHQYSEWCYTEFGFARYHEENILPKWWKEPILCGWGEQCYLTDSMHCGAGDLATQDFYTAMMRRCDKVGLSPATIMIDDKWQLDYGTLEVDTERWPDLRGFVDERHKKGQHVALWFRTWIADGLPGYLCTKRKGLMCTADPTNPRYLAYLKDRIHYLLSDDEGCMNCDGFKLDFLDCLPREMPNIVSYEKGVYGLEMMRRLFEAIYRFAKEIKPDALINTSAVHPYFADICDQVRLHDFWGNTRAMIPMMRFRASIVKAVMPNALIDTDHAHAENRQECLFKLHHNTECGIPVLYSVSNLTDEDLKALSDSWTAYRQTL